MSQTVTGTTDSKLETRALGAVRVGPSLSARRGPSVEDVTTAPPASPGGSRRLPPAGLGPRGRRPRWEAQRSFDELGRPLRDLTFCVVDLETTGGSAEGGSMITEIGAVKVRGGEVLGEFQTLVNPHTEIPPFIAVLTGITNSMVGDAPPIESALPAFLEFAAGCVLVAHNAPFDVGFLQYFAARQGLPLAGVRGARHRQARAPGDHPRRRAQLQALLAGAASSTPRRRPTTGRWPTPGRPSTCCTG